jgi:hypothetical protein
MTNAVTAVGSTNQEIVAVIRKGVCMGTTTEFTTESGEFYSPYDVLDWIENYITQVESQRGASNQKHLNRPPHGLFRAELKRLRAEASRNWRNTLRQPKSRRG